MTTVYQELCEVANVAPMTDVLDWQQFSDPTSMADSSRDARLAAAVRVLVDSLPAKVHVQRVDRVLIDYLIQQLDSRLKTGLDAILHAPEFQDLESRWRGLQHLLKAMDGGTATQVDLLDVDKIALQDDFIESQALHFSGLYQHIYVDEYDTPGGEPYSAMITDFSFSAETKELDLLQSMGQVAASAHCPLIANVDQAFFGKENLADVFGIDCLDTHFEQARYVPWHQFRETEWSRYVGLTFPKFLIRLPYGQQNPVREFYYEETVKHAMKDYCWGAASFSFAANMVTCFQQEGWTVNIRGPASGGKVDNLPLHFDQGFEDYPKVPTQALISETKELSLANLGLIPLSYYKHTNQACFFSANSAQRPKIFNDEKAMANSRINARLPYIFLSSRIAHYLKVLQRETIGSYHSRMDLENKLNTWLQSLITKMPHPDLQVMASHPLKEGQVEVLSVEDNPGFYRVNLHMTPHFQVEGMDVQLSLVSQLPAGET
ncbi:MAG: hypothetical protein DHS20C10_05600 [marine bacterium B5-7]|nr:MAG: hypothetical protein DHS20C10_05600 [marine bacterium B5-7]